MVSPLAFQTEYVFSYSPVAILKTFRTEGESYGLISFTLLTSVQILEVHMTRLQRAVQKGLCLGKVIVWKNK